MNPLDLIAPATMAGHRAKKEAAAFAASVEPGHTYYSVVDCNWPWGKGRLLMEWTASKKKSWIHGQHMFEHLTAAGAWLSYGPIHAKRPGGLLTFAEHRRRPEFRLDAESVLRDARPAPAGV